MSEGLNRVFLFGNLGADPEYRVTQGGQSVLKLRLATSETYLDRNKVRQERTEWHSVTIWGKRGEALNRILSKGGRIFVEGAIRTSSYDDREGNKRYKTEVVASNIILAGGTRRGSSSGDDYDRGGSDRGGGGGAGDYERGESFGGDDPGEDDIPF